MCVHSLVWMSDLRKKPETDSEISVSGCKSTVFSVFLFSDTVFFNYVFYFSL